VAYVIERSGRSGARYVGIYRAADGKYKSAGTYESHERAYEIAEEEERHSRGFLEDTSPADKATMTISEFCEQRFLRSHVVSPGTRQLRVPRVHHQPANDRDRRVLGSTI
jgi:hypothetical protein